MRDEQIQEAAEPPVSRATPTPREQCASFGHIWVDVMAGLARCSRCSAEVFDLNAEPITGLDDAA